MGNDCRDWFVMIMVTAAWVCATIFLFKYPLVPNFITWAGVCGTLTGVYHWLTVKDAKVPDADQSDHRDH